MLAHMLLERLSPRVLPRIPEPDLVMNTPAQVEAFAASGRDDGVLAPIYFFNALHATTTIQPGQSQSQCGIGILVRHLSRHVQIDQWPGLDIDELMHSFPMVSTSPANKPYSLSRQCGNV